ncbi:MAG: hypothetical protein M0001_06885 [Treponema sp.]|nr:hypothetical protein [Treponema sp.]
MKKAINWHIVWVGLYAVAMAYLEAAVVVYLRRIYGIGASILVAPVFDPLISAVEGGRELATLVMLLTVGLLSGRDFRGRLGYFLFAFGVWDIFYYVWLRLLIGWPTSPLDVDLLFLLPLPWWGPVLAPCLIAGLMSLVGLGLVAPGGHGAEAKAGAIPWAALALGALAMLGAFMQDALLALLSMGGPRGVARPGPFDWPLFLAGFSLAIAGLAGAGWFRRSGLKTE